MAGGSRAEGHPVARIRALDGVRGAAVAAVLVFHGGRLEGGFLGVDLFFVLSGFLITALLLTESRATDRISFAGFWARRARRLLPALFLMLAGVALYAVLVAEPAELERIRGEALATLGYVANWRAVFGGSSYWELFLVPSPLQHTWSLAIEEQFYLVWPLVFGAVLAWGRRRSASRADGSSTARRMLALSLGLAGSCAILALGIGEANRVYYGTDTRAPAILFGASLAAWLAWRGPVRTRGGRRRLEMVAFVAVAALAVAWTRLSGPLLYQGGLLLCGLAGAAVVASAAHPVRGPLARAFELRPLVGLGLISYGAYLYHWPLYVYLDEKRVGLDG
ncbi:MAG: acyltransferase [Actinobacteria bacterium]|nr:acyltransferase [Actinomycetota bacterium]